MEQVKSRIFIAASGRALKLAQTMKEALSKDYSEAVLWNEESEGKIPLTRQIASDYDFAVIILARDDVGLKKGDDDMLRQVRDNCIYEFGVFMVSLTLDRCFLISGAMSDTLPVDLRGVQYTLIEEPTDLQDPGACAEAIRKVSEEIKQAVQNKGRLSRGECLAVLPFQEVMKRERLKEDGGRLEEGFVVITDSQPLENYEFAQQIKDNLDKGLSYFYFFPASEDSAQKICRLLQMILVGGLYKESKRAESFADRLEAISQNKDLILTNLKDICQRESLNIYFTPAEPAFQFRLHNAGSSKEAKAYLRYGLGFVEWVEGVNANSIWKYVKQFAKPQLEAVFRSSLFYDLRGSEATQFRASLDRHLKRHFPDLDEEVKKLCYGVSTITGQKG